MTPGEWIAAIVAVGALLAWLLALSFYVGRRDGEISELRQRMDHKAELAAVNNIGAKLNQVSAQADRRSRNIELAVMTIAPKEQQTEIVGILKGE